MKISKILLGKPPIRESFLHAKRIHLAIREIKSLKFCAFFPRGSFSSRKFLSVVTFLILADSKRIFLNIFNDPCRVTKTNYLCSADWIFKLFIIKTLNMQMNIFFWWQKETQFGSLGSINLLVWVDLTKCFLNNNFQLWPCPQNKLTKEQTLVFSFANLSTRLSTAILDGAQTKI